MHYAKKTRARESYRIYSVAYFSPPVNRPVTLTGFPPYLATPFVKTWRFVLKRTIFLKLRALLRRLGVTTPQRAQFACRDDHLSDIVRREAFTSLEEQR